MDYYSQTSAVKVPTGCSPTWYEAVNSEFFYEQNQIQDKKSNNHQMYTDSAPAKMNGTMTVHEPQQPLTTVTTVKQLQNNIEYYQRPISMHFNSDASYLPTPPIQSQSQPSPSLPMPYADDDNAMTSYAPCQGPRPWNFAQCYGFYGQPACSLVNIIDMEDFM